MTEQNITGRMVPKITRSNTTGERQRRRAQRRDWEERVEKLENLGGGLKSSHLPAKNLKWVQNLLGNLERRGNSVKIFARWGDKYGRNLNSKNKNVMKINNPENFRLPTFGPQFNYLLAKNDSYFLYPNEANRYKNKLQNSFQHGGISLEEMLIPVLKMKGISK